jgi:hypothetical protein
MDLLSNEVILYMCDVSHFNFMGFYHVNKYFHNIVKDYKAKMRKYLRFIANTKEEPYGVVRLNYTTINGNRNGYFKQQKSLYKPGNGFINNVVFVCGTYRDNAKHGVWTMTEQGVIRKKCIYVYGKLIVRYNYDYFGKIRNIIHYDEFGMLKGEYPEQQMTIHYRAGLIEE